MVADTGNVALKLKTRGDAPTAFASEAKLIGGMGTKTLQFEHFVEQDENSEDLSYESSNALIVKSVLISNITDFAGNNAILTLPNPGAQGSLSFSSNIRIDNRDPYISSIASPTSNGSYREGAVIVIHIVFDENVVVTGTPQLALETGSSDGVANYTSGSGTKTLVFNYTVLSDHNSNDLNYKNPASALSLNGGTIKDLVGNSASTVLPPAGTLADVKDIIIDNVPPQLLAPIFLRIL